MPERLITIILILHTVFTTACSHNAGHSRDVEQRLEELDRTIEERDRFEAIKTQYIDRIKSKITPGCTEMQRYGIYDNLYDEYYQYNLDSATFYARTKLEVADRIGSPSLKYDAILDIADRYILSGMYVEASEYISQIDAGQLPHELLPRYYHVYHAYYDGMATNAGDPQLREEYLELKSKYRKLLFEKLGEHMLCKEYFPNSNLGMSEELQEAMVAYYDFLVAYQNLLRDGGSLNEVTVTSADGKLNFAPWAPSLGNVVTLGRKVGTRQVVHLLNFSQANSLSWRDLNGTMPEPQLVESVAVDMTTADPVERVWLASPDIDGGAVRELPFENTAIGVRITIPSIKYWDMIVLEQD